MEITQRSQDLASLYTIRAGVSQIAIECDELERLQQEKINLEWQKENLKNQRNEGKERLKELEDKLERMLKQRQYLAKVKSKFIAAIIWLAVLSLVVLAVGVVLEVLFWADWRNLLLPSNEIDFFDGEKAGEELLLLLSYGGAVLVVPLIAIIVEVVIIKRIVNLSEERRRDMIWLRDSYADESQTRKEIKRIKERIKSYNGSKALDEFALKQEHYDALINLHGARIKAIYAALQKQYGAFLDVRDWKNVDLLIFTYETGRADTIKEGLLFVDGERRLNNILQSVELAHRQICASINRGLKQIHDIIGKGFVLLSEQIERNNAVQQAQLNVINENLCTLVQLVDYNNALQAKQNETMERMIEQTTQNLNKLR